MENSIKKFRLNQKYVSYLTDTQMYDQRGGATTVQGICGTYLEASCKDNEGIILNSCCCQTNAACAGSLWCHSDAFWETYCGCK